MNRYRKQNRFLLLAALLVFTFLQTGEPQADEKGRVTGKVIRKDTGKPVPYANLVVAGTPFGAAADSKGRFVLPPLRPGRYRLICSALGYRNAEVEVRLKAGETRHILFRLEPTPIPFQQVVVTASRFQQSLKETPAAIHVLSTGTLRERALSTLPEVLAYVPGVQIAGNNISIRGSSPFTYGLGTRVLVLLDGIPVLSGDDGSAELRSIPVPAIQRVEVLKGSNSALYGSNAMGGVINIITRTPSPDSSYYSFSAYTGFYSQPGYRQWRWTDSRRSFRGAEASYAFGLGHLTAHIAGNYNANDHFKENADFSDWNIFARVRYQRGPDNQIHLTTGHYSKEYGNYVFWKDRNHALQIGNDPEDRYTRTRTRKSYAGIQWLRVFSKALYGQFTLFYQNSLARDLAVPRDPASEMPAHEYRRSAANTLRSQVQFDYQLGTGSHLVAGFESSRSRVRSLQYGNHQVGYVSFYSQLTLDVHQRWKLNLGARFDQESGAQIRKVQQFNPKFGIVYSPGPAQSFRFSAGRGFRVPTVAERFISTVANQVHVVPNPRLRPERNLAIEGGYRRYTGIWGYLDISVFRYDYWDLIEPVLVSEVPKVQFQNLSRARIQGVELSQVLRPLASLRLEIGYTFLHTRDLSRLPDGRPTPDYGKEIKYRPKHLFYSRLTCRWKTLTLGADFRYISKIKRVDRLTNVPDITLQVPAYILDTQVTYRWRKWAITFMVENLLQYYYLQSPGNLGDIRNYTLRIGYAP